MGKKHDPTDVDWWTKKIIDRVDGKAFNRNVGKYSVLILKQLGQIPGGSVSGRHLDDVARQLGIPVKYLTRALGLLSRHRLATLTHAEHYRVTLSGNRSPQMERKRNPVKGKKRKYFFELEGHRCAHCLRKFHARDLRVDHIIPFSMMGADAPGNWGALCRSCNSDKWHNFDREWLRYYRNKPVTKTVGVSFDRGVFWPVINGRTQKMSIEQFSQQMTQTVG